MFTAYIARRIRAAAALAAALIAGTGCADVTTNFGLLNLDLTATRSGRPAPYQRLVIWIEETRLEKVTDAQGKLSLTETYPWDAQTLDLPGVGPLRHSPKPTVAVSLASDPGRQMDGVRTAVSGPDNSWKMSILLDLNSAQ